MQDDTDRPDDVIELRPRHRAAGRDPEALVDYWQGLRQGTAVPRRAEIDPRRIEGLLSDTFIIERIAPGLARFRVAGAHLADLMGMDVRGMPVSSFIHPDRRDGFAGALARLFEEPATVRLDLLSRGGFRQPELSARMVLLPLRSDLGDVSRAMGCLVAEGEAGRVPRRFEVTRLRVAPVDGGNVEVSRPVAEPPRPAPKRRHRPFLRLVTSD
ncbi:PAS domain-containing protein [Roseovarius sp.]|uniref:PAS domain-containing protein n=1 Tax=Roseovarius sp. TaxID=1486281 RepID=UPI003BA9308C